MVAYALTQCSPEPWRNLEQRDTSGARETVYGSLRAVTRASR